MLDLIAHVLAFLGLALWSLGCVALGAWLTWRRQLSAAPFPTPHEIRQAVHDVLHDDEEAAPQSDQLDAPPLEGGKF